jgi:hypothetical protein
MLNVEYLNFKYLNTHCLYHLNHFNTGIWKYKFMLPCRKQKKIKIKAFTIIFYFLTLPFQKNIGYLHNENHKFYK